MSKRCSKCKTEKSLEDFNRSKKYSSGRRCECRDCQKAESAGKSQVSRAEYKKGWQSRNRDKTVLATQRYRDRNPGVNADHYRNNIDYYREYSKNWRKNNPDKNTAKSARYRVQKLRAMPEWLNQEQLNKIDQFYKEAHRLTKETGIIHEVDHIVPLQGKNVCGLHVPWNLQILTQSENAKKGNRIKELLWPRSSQVPEAK